MILWTGITTALTIGAYRGNVNARIGLLLWAAFSVIMVAIGGDNL